MKLIDERAVRRWRHEQLVASGFARPAADRLAEDERYDLHALIELVERGCPPELAERILAPLEEPQCEGYPCSRQANGVDDSPSGGGCHAADCTTR
jgi:hypothetical protein